MSSLGLARRILPKSLRDEVQRYLDAHNKFRSDGTSVASEKTQTERAGEIFRAYAQLWKLGYQKPANIFLWMRLKLKIFSGVKAQKI